MTGRELSATEPRPEYGALLSTRRWIIVISVAVSFGATALVGLLVYPRLSMAEHVLLLAASVLIIAGVVMSSHRAGLVCATSGLVVLVSATAIAPEGSPRWIPLNLLVGYVTYLTIMLTTRAVGLIAIPIGAAAMMLLWSRRPTNAIVANLATFNGWVAVLQLVMSGLFLWWAWNSLRAEAITADRGLAEAERRTLDALATQERARLWRSTAVRLHESVLNTMRYVLTAPDIDRHRLAAEIDRERAAPIPARLEAEPTLAMLLRSLEYDTVVGGAIHVAGWVPDVPLDDDVYEAVRAAAVEIARNAVGHGGATAIEVTARPDVDGQLVVRLVDNGVGAVAETAPGVGTSTVLNTSLLDVGARWERAANPEGGTTSLIWLSRRDSAPADLPGRRAFPPFDKGRLLVTSTLAGIALGGTVNFIRLAWLGGALERLASALGLIGIAVTCLLVYRRRRIDRPLALVLVLAPALIPWFLLGDQYSCEAAGPLSPVLNIAGYCVMVIAAWSGFLPGIVGMLIWAVGGGLLIGEVPAGCRDSVAVALVNSLVALPVMLSVAYAGARAYQRAQERAQETRQREIAERTAATAALDLNSQLDDSVQQAEHLMAEIVDGRDIDADLRARLEQLDGRIRAGIQVDPHSDGAVAVLAKTLVDEAADQGIRVSVRAITCSPDARPVPRELRRLLYRVLVTPVHAAPRLQVFTDGEEDHLSIVTERVALRAAALSPGGAVTSGDFTIEIDDEAEDDDERFAILVSRRIAMVEPATP